MSADLARLVVLALAAGACTVDPGPADDLSGRGDHAATDGLTVECYKGSNWYRVTGAAYFVDDDASSDPALGLFLTPSEKASGITHVLGLELRCSDRDPATMRCVTGLPQATSTSACTNRGQGPIGVIVRDIDCPWTFDDTATLKIQIWSPDDATVDCEGYGLEVRDVW